VASPDAAHEREGRVQQGRDSREVSAADLQHCDWCGAGTLAMLKCGRRRLVYYCSSPGFRFKVSRFFLGSGLWGIDWRGFRFTGVGC